MDCDRIFNKYANGIIKAEYKEYQPESLLNLNLPNKKTVFKIDADDSFLLPSFQYYIYGEYKPEDDTKTYATGANIKLVDNFVAHLFSQVQVKKHNTLLDEIEHVGIASTIKSIASCPSDNSGLLINAGIKSKYHGGGYFSVVGYLSYLGLGFFNDYKNPIYKGGFELTFIRNNDDDAILRWKTKNETESLPISGKIVIKDFTIRVPEIVYDEISKIQLIKELEDLTNKKKYNICFKSWQCIEYKPVSGSTLSYDITNIFRNINKPLFGFVVFQTNRSKNQEKDTSIFEHCNVKNIWFEVNGKRYPDESLDLDWDNEKFCIAYDMLHDYKRIINSNMVDLTFVQPDLFKTHKTVYAIDMSNQPESIAAIKNKIILHVDFNKNISAPTSSSDGTICYICIVSAKIFQYDIINNTITEEH